MPGANTGTRTARPNTTPEDNSIHVGDYVTLDRSYAKVHGESVLMWQQKYPTYKLVSKTVPKIDVVWGQAD
jgi:hypothetical protein